MCLSEDFERFAALYEGGLAFRKLLPKFLPKNPLEGDEYYACRSREAPYRSYVGPIIDFFAAQLFASPFHVRALLEGKPTVSSPFYADLREDVDMEGTDLVSFMKQAFITSLVKGAAWIVAEMPDDNGISAETRADWEARGLDRVRLCHLDPAAVINWECDSYGALEFAVTYSEVYKQKDPRVARTEVTRTWMIYDNEFVETFSITYDPKKRTLRPKDEIPSLGKVPHRFTRIPLLHLRLPPGLWLMNRAADAQIEHFRLSAALSWALKRTAYPMAIYKCDDSESAPVKAGSGYLQRIKREDSIEWITPPSDSFSILQGEIAAQMTEIYRVSQQMAHSVDNSATALGRSGESKIQDNMATEICLHAYADVVKETIESIYELISDGRGDFDLTFSIEGMNKFSLNDITTTLTNMTTAGVDLIQSQTLQKELSIKVSDLMLPDASQQTKDTIREEILSSEPPKPKATPEVGADDTPASGADPSVVKPTGKPKEASLNQN